MRTLELVHIRANIDVNPEPTSATPLPSLGLSHSSTQGPGLAALNARLRQAFDNQNFTAKAL